MTRGDRRGRSDRPAEPPEKIDPGESTLESFVARLHDEGVQAGRDEAERLVEDARREAELIVERARREAVRITEDAVARAEQDLERGRDELRLAARDAVLELTESLRAGLGAIVRETADRELSDPAFLRTLLVEAVGSYARGDADGSGPITVEVPAALEDDLETWALGELAGGISGGNGLLLTPTLEEAGFEYRVGDGTVEVSVESTADLLMRLLTPRLREVVARAAREPAR